MKLTKKIYDEIYFINTNLLMRSTSFGQPPTFQSMQFEGKQKGLMRILTERGFNNKMNKKEMIELLNIQPDFAGQKAWLYETVFNAGHEIIFFPKFHPEFNWIERYWGAAKRFTRRNCDYTYQGLVAKVPIALDTITLSTMRQFARKSYRYMDAYRETMV